MSNMSLDEMMKVEKTYKPVIVNLSVGEKITFENAAGTSKVTVSKVEDRYGLETFSVVTGGSVSVVNCSNTESGASLREKLNSDECGNTTTTFDDERTMVIFNVKGYFKDDKSVAVLKDSNTDTYIVATSAYNDIDTVALDDDIVLAKDGTNG